MPRRRKPLAGCFCARTGKADLKKSATSLAAFLALTDLGWTGWTFGTGRPSRCGSASVKGPSKPLPRKRTTKRWPLPALMMTWASPIFFTFWESKAQSSSQTAVSMRPARRSVTMPLGSRVQKLARAQFQAQPQGFDAAAADLKFQGVVAEQPEVAGSAAGGDARSDGDHAALGGVSRQGIEVGGG